VANQTHAVESQELADDVTAVIGGKEQADKSQLGNCQNTDCIQ
jgi:hypothetical protein